jgi:hypothetical protein
MATQILKVAILYFALVFGAGFVLGTIRTLLVVPRVGTRMAELMEMPIMLVVTIVASRWVVLRLLVPFVPFARLGMGGIALGLCSSRSSGSCPGFAACQSAWTHSSSHF